MPENKPKNLAKAATTKLVLGLFLVSAILVLLVAELVNKQLANYEDTVTKMTQRHLASTVQALANLVSAEELDLFHSAEDTLRPEYQALRDKLLTFSNDNHLEFAYFWRDHGNNRKQYIVDSDPNPDTKVGPQTFEEIDEAIAFEALKGNLAVAELGDYAEGWDSLMTAYAPVYDAEGNVYAIAGVDIHDEFIFRQRQDARDMRNLQLIAIPFAILLAVLNMLLYNKKLKQVQDAHVKLQYFNNNLRRAFSTYLSEDVVEEIVSDPTRLQLGGIKRHMTVLFTDVKNFTRIAETLPPEKLVDLLNYYLSTMSDVILEQKGTIDKYQGDAIVSFFGAPLELTDHALRACLSAIIMKRLESDVNEFVQKEGLSPSPLFTRIGINTGEMVVGNMGTMKKMNYTIVANAVNLASRLEGINKQYGTWILASESTIQETGTKLLTRRLDKIRVVGINEPVRIYEIVETKADATDLQRETVALFEKAHALFEGQNWEKAEAAFDRVLEVAPADGPSLFYKGRCRTYGANPPQDEWDGVLNFEEK